MISSQPEKDLDGRRLTRGSGLRLVNKDCSVEPVFFLLGLGYSTLVAADAIE
uniref:Transposase n=1 Tax=Mesocestoides corti TaxID=53468 RepID=A0A5K3FG73_MESCO